MSYGSPSQYLCSWIQCPISRGHLHLLRRNTSPSSDALLLFARHISRTSCKSLARVITRLSRKSRGDNGPVYLLSSGSAGLYFSNMRLIGAGCIVGQMGSDRVRGECVVHGFSSVSRLSKSDSSVSFRSSGNPFSSIPIAHASPLSSSSGEMTRPPAQSGVIAALNGDHVKPGGSQSIRTYEQNVSPFFTILFSYPEHTMSSVSDDISKSNILDAFTVFSGASC